MNTKNRLTELITGSISPEEKAEILGKIDQDNRLKKEYLELLHIWKLTSLGSTPVSYQKRIEEFERFWRKRTKSTRSMVFIRAMQRYAAVFIAAVLLIYLIQHFAGEPKFIGKEAVLHHYNLETNYGSISRLQLKDGSEIWLNSNSSIQISEMKKKHVAVLDGEAYFDIIHNEKREFRIDLGELEIIDRGTGFNISSYPDDEMIRTILVEGNIDLRNKINNSLVTLNPGEGYLFDRKTKVAKLFKSDGLIETSWREGKFVFVDKTLEHICSNLSKWYNIEFVFSNPELAQTRYTCNLKRTTTVDQILKILQSVSGINYKIISDEKGSRDVIRLY